MHSAIDMVIFFHPINLHPARSDGSSNLLSQHRRAIIPDGNGALPVRIVERPLNIQRRRGSHLKRQRGLPISLPGFWRRFAKWLKLRRVPSHPA